MDTVKTIKGNENDTATLKNIVFKCKDTIFLKVSIIARLAKLNQTLSFQNKTKK
jgi:hypothetical protein